MQIQHKCSADCTMAKACEASADQEKSSADCTMDKCSADQNAPPEAGRLARGWTTVQMIRTPPIKNSDSGCSRSTPPSCNCRRMQRSGGPSSPCQGRWGRPGRCLPSSAAPPPNFATRRAEKAAGTCRTCRRHCRLQVLASPVASASASDREPSSNAMREGVEGTTRQRLKE